MQEKLGTIFFLKVVLVSLIFSDIDLVLPKYR